jgi:hypothetical protein
MMDKSTLINKLILRWIDKKKKNFKFDANMISAAHNITHTSLGALVAGDSCRV